LRARPKAWLGALGVFGVGAALSPFDDNIDRWAVRHRSGNTFSVLKEFREGGNAFSGKVVTPIAIATLGVALVAKNQTLQEGLFGCLSSYAASSVVRNYVVYPLIARDRPDQRIDGVVFPAAEHGDQYDFDVPGSGEWGGHSFPGGHIANVAACAEFLTARYSMGFVEPALWLVVGGIGVGRVLDRRHWTSDQVVGALFGYAVGREVALRSIRRANRSTDRRTDSGGLFLSPTASGVRGGWSVDF
jgi:membrane-associated phospholipid phosphatase